MLSYESPPMKRGSLILLAILILLPPFAWAKWLSQNRWQDWGITIARPSERWRVVKGDQPNTVLLKYLRRGKDVVIRISRKPQRYFFLTQERFQDPYRLKKFKKNLLGDYEQQGFRFVEFKRNNGHVHAEGVNKNRQYLLLRFILPQSSHEKKMTVVETILDNGDYLDFRDDFLKIARSVSH